MKNIEWCANCEEEVLLESNLEPQPCPNCGVVIMNCTHCLIHCKIECGSENQPDACKPKEGSALAYELK